MIHQAMLLSPFMSPGVASYRARNWEEDETHQAMLASCEEQRSCSSGIASDVSSPRVGNLGNRPVLNRGQEQGHGVAPQQQGQAEQSTPPWIGVMLATPFFGPCDVHRQKKNECTFFCITCAEKPRGLCQHCMHEHTQHRVIQIRRYVYCDVVRAVDMQPFVDTNGIQAYIINQAKVVFLNARPQSKLGRPGDPDCCLSCSRNLREGFAYCCVACKVQALGSGLAGAHALAAPEGRALTQSDQQQGRMQGQTASEGRAASESCQQQAQTQGQAARGIPRTDSSSSSDAFFLGAAPPPSPPALAPPGPFVAGGGGGGVVKRVSSGDLASGYVQAGKKQTTSSRKQQRGASAAERSVGGSRGMAVAVSMLPQPTSSGEPDDDVYCPTPRARYSGTAVPPPSPRGGAQAALHGAGGGDGKAQEEKEEEDEHPAQRAVAAKRRRSVSNASPRSVAAAQAAAAAAAVPWRQRPPLQLQLFCRAARHGRGCAGVGAGSFDAALPSVGEVSPQPPPATAVARPPPLRTAVQPSPSPPSAAAGSGSRRKQGAPQRSRDC